MAGYGKRYTQEFKDSAIQLALNSQRAGYMFKNTLWMVVRLSKQV